ncbi:MAG: TerB family tellurite resistance protein [SAR324 cluster bacterium]|nr:TerB family tellurite resistance protein [SAR324 cluster bacterium]MCH8886304.1 TerB family tellurite resistance protein [SAR324 cluster bacterium]
MLQRLKTLLKGAAGSEPQGTQLPDEQLAVCAILLEVAYADEEFAPEEFRVITDQLKSYFGLEPEAVEKLIALAETERQAATDLWPFTRKIARDYTPDKKEALLTIVWQVIFADGKLDPYEDQLARRFQSMLSVNHSVLMAAKSKARALHKEKSAQ